MNPSVSFATRHPAASIRAIGQRRIPARVEKIHRIADSIRHAWPFKASDDTTPCQSFKIPSPDLNGFVS